MLAIVEDLMFSVQILDMAKARGLAVKTVKSAADALGLLPAAPRAVIIDLNQPGLDAVACINNLKRTAPEIPVVGFVSHVQTELRQAAAAAGAEHVLPRSAFASRLPGILASL